MPCMCLFIYSVVKPSKRMGAQEDCISIGNLSTLTLKRIGSDGYVKVNELLKLDVKTHAWIPI